MANVEPNQYTMHGQGVKVTFTTNGFLGQPTLHYEHGTLIKDFKGTEVRVLSAEIGKLVSVTIALTVDAGSTSFSALIPAIALPDASSSAKFHTAGITTIHKTGLVPPTGVLETYDVIRLEGTAREVEVPLGAPAQ